MDQVTERKYILTHSQIHGIAEYLATRPYREVSDFFVLLQSLKPLDEPPTSPSTGLTVVKDDGKAG